MIVDPDLDKSCFFFDVDGTLLDIADRPDLVEVPEQLKQALAALERAVSGALALVSGRAIETLDHLFAPLKLRASGVHGAETRLDTTSAPLVSPDDLLPQGLIDDLQAAAADVPGTLVENKRFSAAIHYRRAPAAGPTLKKRIEAILARNEIAGLRILPGHMVFDLKRMTFDKGRAVDRFMEAAPFAGRRPVFVGDDVTDEPAFAAVVARGGIAYAVGQPRAGSSDVFADPSAVRAWVSDLAASEHNHA